MGRHGTCSLCHATRIQMFPSLPVGRRSACTVAAGHRPSPAWVDDDRGCSPCRVDRLWEVVCFPCLPSRLARLEPHRGSSVSCQSVKPSNRQPSAVAAMQCNIENVLLVYVTTYTYSSVRLSLMSFSVCDGGTTTRAGILCQCAVSRPASQSCHGTLVLLQRRNQINIRDLAVVLPDNIS
jgi:hypothetical protein